MTKKPDEWMPLHVRKYLGDTMHLTRDQHGAYLLLLMAYWMLGGALPGSDGELAAIARATKAEWARIKPVLSRFFEERDGKWVQKRAEEELAKARKFTEAKSAAGRKGAENRWQVGGTAIGTGMAQLSPSQCLDDAPLPQPIPIQNKKELSSFVVGRGKRGGDSVTIEDPNERIARFQKTIAQALGRNGWTIVAAAADPTSPDYDQALDACKAAAKRLGKGWPHLWPAPVHRGAA